MTTIRSGIPTRIGTETSVAGWKPAGRRSSQLVGWSWVYEPVDADGYIPDFLIQGNYPFFVEVGACITLGDYGTKSTKPDSAAPSLGHDVLVVGVSPIHT